MSMARLKLGPLPSREMFKVTVILPAALRSDLIRYAELLVQSSGPLDGIEQLIPHMLESFMETDSAFQRLKRQP